MENSPQGISDDQFAAISATIRAAVSHIGEDIHVQGSRANGTARLDSDLDIAIRISDEGFEKFLTERFGSPNPGTAKQRTMLHARETGKIQAGEAGLRQLRRNLEGQLGMEVDISVIRIGGQFDRPPYLELNRNVHT